MSSSRTKPVPSSAVKVTPDRLTPSASETTIRYWIGTTPDCPIQNVTVGGVTFPRFRGNPMFDASGAADRELQYGIYADLTPGQVDSIQKGVAIRALRTVGADRDHGDDAPDTTAPRKRRGVIVMTDRKPAKEGGPPPYRAGPNDRPLAQYLYMHRLDEMSAEDHRRFPPETMLQE